MRSAWVLLFLAAPAAALDRFSERALEVAQAGGRVAAVQVHSSASPVCRRQAQILGRLAEAERGRVAFLQADFDRDAEFRRRHGVEGRCVLLAFRRGVLIGREAGLTTEPAVRAFLHESLIRARGRPKPRPGRPARSGR